MELNNETIEKAMSVLKRNNVEIEQLAWIDNEHFYKSQLAKAMGFECSDEEINEAKNDSMNFIKKAQGVNLYLSKFLSSNPL